MSTSSSDQMVYVIIKAKPWNSIIDLNFITYQYISIEQLKRIFR